MRSSVFGAIVFIGLKLANRA